MKNKKYKQIVACFLATILMFPITPGTVYAQTGKQLEPERIESELAAQEAQQKIDNLQNLISTLPEVENITADNLEDVKAQLAAIEAAKAELNETQQASLQMEKYNAAVERIAALEAEPQKAPANTQEAGSEPTENDVAAVTIDGTTRYYEDFGDAITAASNETAVITLLKDTTYYNADGISIYGNVTFKGNHTVDSGDSWEDLILYCYGSVKIEEGIYKDTVLSSNEGGNAEIIGGALKRVDTNAGTIIIRGGTIDASSCTMDANSSITVTGGTIEMLTGYKGNITIKQGTINSLYAKGASINIMGGTINQIKGSEGINYNPESIALDKTELLLEVGKSEKLTATVTPNISAPGFPVWESNNEAVATVNNGIVTAVAPGEATITVTAGEKTETCKVTVAEDYVATVTIDGVETYCSTLEETFEIANGNTATIKLLKSIIDEKGEIKNHGTISSGVITLDMNGHTLDTPLCSIAVSGGTLIITGSGELDKVGAIPGSSGIVILESGKVGMATPIFEGTFIVRGGTLDSPLSPNATIKFEPGKLLLDKTELSLEAGKFEKLTATVEPSISAPGFGYSWESSNEAVATVNNGTVTAVGAGTADITVKAGNKSRICKVTVTEDVASVTIGDQTKNYTDLDKAAEAVSGTGGTLTLLKDVSGRTQPLELSGLMTFDLGGHTLSGAWEDDPYGGLLEITSGVVEVKNGNVSVPGDTGVLCCAIAVREGATLSGNATYSANAWGDVVYNKGTIREGNFHGSCNLYGTVQGGNFHTSSIQMFGKIEGGNFNNTGGNSNLDRPREVGFGPDGVILGGTFTNLKFMYGVNGLFQGGIFNNCVFSSIRDDYFSGETNLAPGYVAYDTSGKIVIDRQPQIKLPPMYFTGTIEPHKSHTYDFTTHEDGNGNYTYSEGSCPICGITAPEGAAYTVTIPKTAQLGSDTEVSVNNSLSQEKTVTVSVNEKQVTLTRENDPEQTKIISDVTFDDISVRKGQKDTEKVIFAPPVYNNDPAALIPAGTYKGTLTFTIGMQ